MKMSWVTLDRICAEEMLSDEKIRRLVEGGNRPLRSRAEQLNDAELLDKLRGFGWVWTAAAWSGCARTRCPLRKWLGRSSAAAASAATMRGGRGAASRSS